MRRLKAVAGSLVCSPAALLHDASAHTPAPGARPHPHTSTGCPPPSPCSGEAAVIQETVKRNAIFTNIDNQVCCCGGGGVRCAAAAAAAACCCCRVRCAAAAAAVASAVAAAAAAACAFSLPQVYSWHLPRAWPWLSRSPFTHSPSPPTPTHPPHPIPSDCPPGSQAAAGGAGGDVAAAGRRRGQRGGGGDGGGRGGPNLTRQHPQPPRGWLPKGDISFYLC